MFTIDDDVHFDSFTSILLKQYLEKTKLLSTLSYPKLNKHFFDFMNQEKETLRKRELEVQRLIRQMKFDELQNSQVYRKLEQELQQIKQNLEVITEGSQGRNS